MPLEDDDYVPDDAETYFNSSVTSFEDTFEDGEVTAGAIIEAIFDVHSTVLSQNQEQSLDEIFDAAFLDTATGEHLDLVVDLLGMSRRDPVSSTGVVTWLRDDRANQDYVVQNGTTVTTGGSSPISFETTESTIIRQFDGFEDGSLQADWNGDTGSATVQNTTVLDDNFSLELDSTDGALVYLENNEIQHGSTTHWNVRASSNTVPVIVFGLQDSSNYYQVTIDSSNNDVALERVEGGSISETLETVSNTVPVDTKLSVDVQWDVDNDITATVVDTSNDSEIATVSGTDDTWSDGFVGCKSGDATGTKYFDEIAMSRAAANVEAVNGGTDGNVGPNTITQMPSPPAGVAGVTNPIPTGDETYTDTDGITLITGQSEETDGALRERARETTTAGGSATVDALLSSLVNEHDDIEDRGVANVESARLFTNRTNTDNTGSGGLPPKSFEAVVHGGDSTEIARAIFDTMAVTDRSYGGAHGSSVTETVQTLNGQEWDVTFSRPTEVSIDVTMSIIVDSTYDGDDALRDEIVDYIGGTDSSGNTILGTGVFEDVRIDEIEQIINDVDGVLGFDSDATTTFETTPSSTTDSDGLDVISIGESEIASTDAGSIDITTTTV